MIKSTYIVVLGAFLYGTPAWAQSVGTCESPEGEAYLDVNGVRARILNTGGLFYRGEPHVYNVPRFTNSNAVFAGGVWIAGKVDGAIRAAAAKYQDWEYWAGPLGDDGSPPSDCADYDRLYKVSRPDIADFEDTGAATPDLLEWPTGLGAPTIDRNGGRIEVMSQPLALRRDRIIDLASGERPDFKGDQIIWWAMNDMGNTHVSTGGAPLGLEIHGSAYAAASTNAAINNATIYGYRLWYRGADSVDSLYFGLWLDTDLGNFADDYVGSDSLLGLGYAYNADNDDEGVEGYGTPPPALGAILLQGPLTDSDGMDNNRDGFVDEAGERAHVAHVMRVEKSVGDPRNGLEYFNNLKGRWSDGLPMTIGGSGHDLPGTPINYAFPGDPATSEFWSMMNADGAGNPSSPADYRFLVSVGPMALDPGDEIDLTFAVVWSHGLDHLDSVTELKAAASELQAIFDGGFENIPRGVAPATASLRSPAAGVVDQPTSLRLYWEPLAGAEAYEIEVSSADTTLAFGTVAPHVDAAPLSPGVTYLWRVRGVNVFGNGPWSSTWQFSTGDVSFAKPFFAGFSTVRNAAGPVDPADMAAFAFNSSGFPFLEGTLTPVGSYPEPDRPNPGVQQSTSDAVWGFHAGGASHLFGVTTDTTTFLGRVTRARANLAAIGPDDYEIRFTAKGGSAVRAFEDQAIIDVPFELWNIGKETPTDTLDDYRLIPAVCEAACGAGTTDGIFDIGGDHAISGGTNDPTTDWMYWFQPQDRTPGEAGYAAYFDGTDELGKEVFAAMVLVQQNGGEQPPYTVELPETGSVFRITAGERSTPILAAPGNGANLQNVDVAFYWSGAADDVYTVQIAMTSDFSAVEVDSTGVSPGFTPPLNPGTTYYWRVHGVLSGWSDTWMFNSFSTTSVEDNDAAVGRPMLSNYPNPFGDYTTISVDLVENAYVVLDVYDVLGRRIKRLVDRRLPRGAYKLPFDGRGLGSGVYIATLSVDAHVITKIMVLAG